jgi:hypothetical protein
MQLPYGLWGVGTMYVALAAWLLLNGGGGGTTDDDGDGGGAELGYAPWRWLVVAASAPCFAALASLGWVPESPQWYLGRGDAAAALAVVRRIARENGAADMPEVTVIGCPPL